MPSVGWCEWGGHPGVAYSGGSSWPGEKSKWKIHLDFTYLTVMNISTFPIQKKTNQKKTFAYVILHNFMLCYHYLSSLFFLIISYLFS